MRETGGKEREGEREKKEREGGGRRRGGEGEKKGSNTDSSCVHVRACMHACMCACVHVCVCACMHVYMCICMCVCVTFKHVDNRYGYSDIVQSNSASMGKYT